MAEYCGAELLDVHESLSDERFCSFSSNIFSLEEYNERLLSRSLTLVSSLTISVLAMLSSLFRNSFSADSMLVAGKFLF